MTPSLSFTEMAKRLTSERERLGLTVEQLAVLVGISAAQQRAIEEGRRDQVPMDYAGALHRLGADTEFIHGFSEAPSATVRRRAHEDEDFLFAVALLRRSREAVEAFAGKGASVSCPQLVAATMHAAIQSRFAVGPGGYEELADKISAAIESAGSAIADAIRDTTDPGDDV